MQTPALPPPKLGGKAVLGILALCWDIGQSECDRSLGDFQDIWYLATISSYCSLSA